MNKIILHIVFAALALGSHCLFASGPKPSAPPAFGVTAETNAAPKTVSIYSNLAHGTELRGIVEELGVNQMIIVTEGNIVPRYSSEATQSSMPLNLQWTASRVDQYLDRYVPKNFAGYLCLDWESPFHVLTDPNDSHYNTTVQQFVSLTHYVKRQRPNAKVGYYGIPLTDYWPIYGELTKSDRATQYEARMRHLAPIMNASDVLFPTMYDFYTHDQTAGPTRDTTVFAEIIRTSLTLSGGREVVPFTWDRYHDGGSIGEHQFRTIPAEEYKDTLTGMLRAEYEGDRIDGLMIWGADEWFYQHVFKKDSAGRYTVQSAWANQLRTVFTEECKYYVDVETCLNQRKVKTYEHIVDVLLNIEGGNTLVVQNDF